MYFVPVHQTAYHSHQVDQYQKKNIYLYQIVTANITVTIATPKLWVQWTSQTLVVLNNYKVQSTKGIFLTEILMSNFFPLLTSLFLKYS